MNVIKRVDIEKIAEAALLIEADINEALGELRALRVSASKNAISPSLILKKTADIIKILER